MFLVLFSGFIKASLVYAALVYAVCKIWDNDRPSIRFDVSLQNFKKSLDIFWLQIER